MAAPPTQAEGVLGATGEGGEGHGAMERGGEGGFWGRPKISSDGGLNHVIPAE